MLSSAITVMNMLLSMLKYPLIAIGGVIVCFYLLCGVWYLILHYKGYKMPKSSYKPPKKHSVLHQVFIALPKRYMLDRFERDADYFSPKGIHMFCGEQGSGKTIACVEMIMKLQKSYPKSKTISNFGLTTENDELSKWELLLDYVNGKQGVIVGIDEIQNWFMSGNNKLPEGMLEIVTQNRKNCRVLCCTAQVFTRVNKGIREQVNMVYNPHTILGCFTIVIKRKPVFDSEGNVTEMKYRGMYTFTHTKELRDAYDTYKVIHTLSKEGFKEQAPVSQINNTYIVPVRKVK